MFDHAFIAAQLDDIADFDRPLEEQDEAGDKVIDDILQPETQTHAEGAH